MARGPRSRGRRRRRAPRRRAPVSIYSYSENYGPGAGQINITGKLLDLPTDRVVTPISARIQICLRSSEAISATTSEFVVVRLFEWAHDNDIISQLGPYLIGTQPKTIRVKWPRIAPTQLGVDDMTKRKLIAMYDFGVNTKLGLGVVCHVTVKEGVLVRSSTQNLDELPEKRKLSDSPTTSASPFENLKLDSPSM